MIDSALLRTLGWSEDLIAASMSVSRELSESASAVQVPYAGVHCDVTFSSSEIDVSGPPVGARELLVDRGPQGS